MAVLPDFEYDIFISYRHNDNRSGWVTEFVNALREELAATIKEPLSIYFDKNPHDGLLETHNVDKSLEGKLKCLIFIPVLSRTYCDPKCFAWTHEFVAFRNLAKETPLGIDVKLPHGNVGSRVLPIKIHELDARDQALFEKVNQGILRSIDFVFISPGVNRPLTPHDSRADNQNKTFYRDQVNKTANAIGQILEALQSPGETNPMTPAPSTSNEKVSDNGKTPWIWKELIRRNVPRAALVYTLFAILFHQLLIMLTPFIKMEERYVNVVSWALVAGFVVATVLAWFFEVGPGGLIRTNTQQSMVNPFPPHRRKPLTSAPLVVVLILVMLLQYIYFNYLKSPVARPENFAGQQLITLAVLPFENRSGNEQDKYIADGISDDIINRLTIISKLKVTNRGKIQPYRNHTSPFDEIARALGVKVILTGSVERQANQVAVRVQLIDESGTYIWGNTFQRTTENMMAVQSEIAQVIADQLKLQLNDSEKERIHQRPTRYATAYDNYLRGRSHYFRYQPAANDSAIELFKLAIAIDPKYARAWAGLGDAYSQMNMRFGRSETWLDSSVTAGSKAIQLDSTLSEAYKALANAYSYKKLYDQAFPLLVKAVELNPTNDQAVGNLGTNYLLRGDLSKALQLEKKGVGMDPKNWIPYQLTGWIYRLLGDLGNAELWFLKALELNPVYDTYELLAYAYVAQGRRQTALNLVPRVLELGNDARALEVAGLISHYAGDATNAKIYFQRSIDVNPDYKADPNTVSPIGLGQILLQQGSKVDADVYLSHAMNINLDQIAKGSQSYEPSFYIAAVHAIRGNKEQALNWLRKAADLNWIDYNHVLYGPYFAQVKTDPAFLQVVQIARNKSDAMRKQAEGD